MSSNRSAPNRLAKESSPYLRQHAHNPVDWHPWGEEALTLARKEGKPILLSVGYSACHWCHVMAHESFENAETAALMNGSFVNIKVDREERPDVDQLYQGVVQLMGRGGGWPLTVFLTPDLRPFYGGTYFPPADAHGLPSFPRVLAALREAWTGQRADIERQAADFQAGLVQLSTRGLEAAPRDLTAADVVSAARRLESAINREHGGFGGAPKFPNPMNLALLLRGDRRGGGEELRSAALLTLRRMAEGGIYNQLGGGFHRYTVDAHWRVPHFEKMLYDNAQLLHLYAEAEQVAPEPLWRRVAEETAAYVHREMTAPSGAFFAAQDADSEGEEGKFFVWTPEQLRAVLPAALADLAQARFGVTAEGSFEHGTSVLEVRASLPELAKRAGRSENEVAADLATARGLLFAARERRVKPGRDDKVLAGWNGLMIRGLASAGLVFERPEWIDWARAAADVVLGRMRRPDGALLRVMHGDEVKIDAVLEDYGGVASGLLALHQATFEPRYLEQAESLVRLAGPRFFDPERGAYLAAPRGQADLVVPPYALYDNAFPSGASTLTEAQVTLAALTGRVEHLAQAERYLKQMGTEMSSNPLGYGHLWLAADGFVDGATGVVVAANASERAALLGERPAIYAPTFAWTAHDPDAAPPPVLAEVLEGKGRYEGKPAAYVCHHFTCERPFTDPAALARRLRGWQRRTTDRV